MADCATDRLAAWRKFAPCCLSDATWELAAKTRDAVLSHRSCPWGGHMIKIDSKSMFIQDAPEDPCNVLVRPEVRAMCQPTEEIHLRCIETYSPGHALLERTNSMFILQVVSVLFGNVLYPSEGSLYEKLPMLAQHQLYKDFPEPGDCSYVMGNGIWIMRRSPHSRSHYRLVHVFSTPADSWIPRTPFLPAFTDMFHRALDRVLNGPTFKDLRTIDEKMYLVLSIRTYNRGHPMIPHTEPCSEDTFTVLRGQHLGLITWGRFKPREKLYLSEYLHCFMQQLGHELKTYDTLDGRKLVPYQCVVVRHEWDQLRASFFEAFKVQKAAYRHANGGTSTPSLSEDAHPHFVSWAFADFAQPEVTKTVVRKTFLELDEGSIGSIDCLKRSISTGEVMTSFV